MSTTVTGSTTLTGGATGYGTLNLLEASNESRGLRTGVASHRGQWLLYGSRDGRAPEPVNEGAEHAPAVVGDASTKYN